MAASTRDRERALDELGPFFPEPHACEPLLDRAAGLVAEAHRLEAVSGPLASALRPLLRTMNAFYASELEGRPLRPVEIERATLEAGAVSEEGRARAHALARAHVDAETALSSALPTRAVGLYAPDFVQCIHAELHRTHIAPSARQSVAPPPREGSVAAPRDSLSSELLASSISDARRRVALQSGVVPADPRLFDALEGGRLSLEGVPALGAELDAEVIELSLDERFEAPPDLCPAPGAWRLGPVSGRQAARAESIADLLEQWQGVYSKPGGLEPAIIGALCAQQRMLVARPFEHGNGRTARLHTQLVLEALGLTRGLWSPFRGMARDREGYQARLRRAWEVRAAAGERERVGRHELEGFASWLLDVCLEEARATRELLDGERLKNRLGDLLAWLGARPWVMGSEKSVVKPDALEALHYAAIAGPVERARFIAMLGLQHRTGRRVLSSLLDFGVLVSESSRAPVRFNLPLASLRFLFPGFWADAGAPDEPMSASAWPRGSEGAGLATPRLADAM